MPRGRKARLGLEPPRMMHTIVCAECGQETTVPSCRAMADPSSAPRVRAGEDRAGSEVIAEPVLAD